MEWTTALILNLILALHQVFWGLLVYYIHDIFNAFYTVATVQYNYNFTCDATCVIPCMIKAWRETDNHA